MIIHIIFRWLNPIVNALNRKTELIGTYIISAADRYCENIITLDAVYLSSEKTMVVICF